MSGSPPDSNQPSKEETHLPINSEARTLSPWQIPASPEGIPEHLLCLNRPYPPTLPQQSYGVLTANEKDQRLAGSQIDHGEILSSVAYVPVHPIAARTLSSKPRNYVSIDQQVNQLAAHFLQGLPSTAYTTSNALLDSDSPPNLQVNQAVNRDEPLKLPARISSNALAAAKLNSGPSTCFPTNQQASQFNQFQALPSSVYLPPNKVSPNMSYQNYLDSPQSGPSNPRQAPPSPSQQNMAHTNGMNGGMGMGNGMVGYPTPAGHQSDLNYVMSMVDELSQVLRTNQQLTASVVDKMGKVREKAQTMNLSNDEMIAAVASEMNEDSQNLEKENSELRTALEKSEYNKKENWKLAVHGANILADLSEKMHRFKEQHEGDTLAWHKNYRNQLAEEREENLNLRNQINDMKAAACRANGHLRDMRKYLNDHDELQELRAQVVQYRQERRYWKRMAMPLIPDDDSEWSDDDDLIDPEEKKREAEVTAAKIEAERMKKEEGGEGPAA